MHRPTSGRCARLLGAAACFLLLALLPASTSLADPGAFFPKQAEIVLLSGLSGDIESETAYRGHLATWLELCQQHDPARMFVLSDDTNGISLPEKAILFSATRTNFLSLGATLRSSTNPLVVVAWGHGGKQGSTPVFHVRGPRITPEDLGVLADQSAAPISRWILLFRGSGAFAARIAGESREILSSDATTMFGSDPIVMTPLLKVLRSDPSASLASVLTEAGRSTARWYEERSLARTEEPAFWKGHDKPRLLAAEEATKTLEGENAIPLSAEADEQPKRPRGLETQAPPPLPASWTNIKRIDPEKYPDADAVSLLRRTSFTLGQSPAIAGEIEEFIQVLTAEGKRLGDFDVSYHPPQEDLVFLDCEVLRADGRLERLDPDNVRETREESLGQYQTGQRKFFSLPGVGPGAVLHIRYRSSWRTFPMPHVSMALPLARDIPQVRQHLEISLPKGAPFHFAFENVEVGDPEVRQSSYGTTYSWGLTNIPPADRDILMSPGQRPQVLFSSFPDWSAFASWYHRLTQMTGELSEEISAKAKEVAALAKSDHEKISAIYHYVTSMRYVAVPLGVNSLRPHSAENVFRNQFGDCKDKANLFNTMLRALGLNAHLVLVPRFGQAHEDIPGLAFNHAISRVTLGDETLWIDTTDDVCRFGMLPPGDPGRKVLVIDGVTTNLTELPRPNPADHSIKLATEVRLTAGATPAAAHLKLVARGYPDYELRTARQSHLASSLPILSAEYQTINGMFALEKQSSTPVSALDQDFGWEAHGSFAGLVSATSGLTLVTTPFWLPDEWFLALHKRSSPLFLNQGYPSTLEQELTIHLPQASKMECPPSAAGDSPPLRWRLEWRQVSAQEAAVRLRVALSHGELDLAQTRDFQMQLRSLITACASPLKLLP